MKLYISAINNNNLESAIRYGCKYVLYSYYTLSKIRNSETLLSLLKLGNIFLDSGAHTLQKPGNNVDWDKYVKNYIEFIKKYKRYISVIVELDIENKVGLKKVEEWRTKIGKETGIEPVVVWHKERGWEYYKEMCKKYKYVGFSGFVVDNTGENEVPNKFIKIFIEEAHKNGAKVHGFGYTRASISNLGFDSVDSSSWICGVKFGNLFKYKNGRMTYKRIKNFNKEAYPKIIDINMREWVKYQKDLDKK